jgi:3-aminobutyryl-CoA ammonia-lyase
MNVRIGNEWTHYGGEMVAGALMLQLWGDCVSEISIRREGHGGYLVGCDKLQFHHPVHTGDSLVINARLSKQGRRSRQFSCTAHLLLSRYNGMEKSEGWEKFDPAKMVAEGLLTVVIPAGSADRRDD